MLPHETTYLQIFLLWHQQNHTQACWKEPSNLPSTRMVPSTNPAKTLPTKWPMRIPMISNKHTLMNFHLKRRDLILIYQQSPSTQWLHTFQQINKPKPNKLNKRIYHLTYVNETFEEECCGMKRNLLVTSILSYRYLFPFNCARQHAYQPLPIFQFYMQQILEVQHLNIQASYDKHELDV